MNDFNVSQHAETVGKNESLLCGCSDERCMFLILNGRVGIYKSHDKGNTMVTDLGSGEFIGAVAFFSEITDQSKFIAIEDTMVIRINRTNINQFIAANPNTIIKLMARLSENIRSANEAFSHSAVKEVNYIGSGTIAPPDILEGRMFPSGHMKYPQKIDDKHLKFLFDKTIKCPVCEKDFSVYQIKRSKLRLIQNGRDCRKLYEGFDDVWYDIWVCPHCHYANFHYEFFKITNLQKMELKQKLLLVEYPAGKTQLLKKNYDQVFYDYYQALACKTILESSSYEMGRLWLRLAWLYKDCNYTEMYEMAYQQARQYYCDGWFNTKRRMDIAEEQRLCVLIGEMYLAEKDFENAKKFFFMGVKNIAGAKAMNLVARNRLDDVNKQIRSMRK